MLERLAARQGGQNGVAESPVAQAELLARIVAKRGG